MRVAILIILLHSTAGVYAQQNDVPLQREILAGLERDASHRDQRVFTGLKPVIESRAVLDNTLGYAKDTAKYYYWFTKKLLSDNLLVLQEDGLRITVDPLLDVQLGRDFGDVTAYTDTNNLYLNTRGAIIRGDLGPKLSFSTMFLENQGIVPQYLFLFSQQTGALPGQGRVKVKVRRRLDYGWSQAVLSYSPWRALNVQLAYGRQFVGHGYRSVLLSDNASPHPMLKFSAITRDKRLQYTTWHAMFTPGFGPSARLPTGAGSEALFYRTRARFNHVAFFLGPVELGFFEGAIFEIVDADGFRPLDPLELNPLIGVNTLVRGFEGRGRQMIGADLRVKIMDRFYLYGQAGTDGPSHDRFAWQAGLRAFDVGVPGLDLQVEYNTATAFTYTGDPNLLAWRHAGQPLAHPMGTWFDEAVAIAEYRNGRWLLQAKANLGAYRRDPDELTRLGGEFYRAGTPIGEGEPVVQRLTYLDANVSYLLNPKTNLRLFLGCWRRDLPGAPDGQQSTYLQVALRSDIFNRYYDL